MTASCGMTKPRLMKSAKNLCRDMWHAWIHSVLKYRNNTTGEGQPPKCCGIYFHLQQRLIVAINLKSQLNISTLANMWRTLSGKFSQAHHSRCWGLRGELVLQLNGLMNGITYASMKHLIFVAVITTFEHSRSSLQQWISATGSQFLPSEILRQWTYVIDDSEST